MLKAIKEKGGMSMAQEEHQAKYAGMPHLIADPPFSKLDLISCRDLLILKVLFIHAQSRVRNPGPQPIIIHCRTSGARGSA